MHVHHGSAQDTTQSGLGTTSLDRRALLRHSTAGLAATAVTLAGLRTGRVAAQSAEASPSANTPATPATGGGNGYAPVNGLNLYYEIHGTGGQPLVLLHGGLVTIDLTFGTTMPTLAQNRQVIAVELQGHGHTADVDRPMTFEAMADDVAALLAYLGIPNADLFGYSLGGGVAWQTAIRHPEIVRKIVAASAPVKRDGWVPQVISAMSAMNPDVAAAMMQTPLYEAYVKVAPKPEDWPTLVTKVGQTVAQNYDWTDAVRSITSPVLLVIGDADSVRPAHALDVFELLGGGVPGDFGPLPKSQFAVLPGTAHSALPSRADLLLPVITPFLEAPMP